MISSASYPFIFYSSNPRRKSKTYKNGKDFQKKKISSISEGRIGFLGCQNAKSLPKHPVHDRTITFDFVSRTINNSLRFGLKFPRYNLWVPAPLGTRI